MKADPGGGRDRGRAGGSRNTDGTMVRAQAIQGVRWVAQEGVMQENKADRETRLRELASKLFFTLKGQGSQFALSRDVDVPKLVRHDGLTLDEVEDILNTWKLRGHGG
jgi:hypothetical protein